MKVSNNNECITKLYRLINIYDFMISKLTEYETLFHLKYDEQYNKLTKNHDINNYKTN